LKLRAYKKKIRDTTTSLGHIIWSKDRTALSYKDTELKMTKLQDFILNQVNLAQSKLEDLLLIYTYEAREDIVPTLVLRDLKDDLTNNKRG
jgi:hypothetical protein